MKIDMRILLMLKKIEEKIQEIVLLEGNAVIKIK